MTEQNKDVIIKTGRRIETINEGEIKKMNDTQKNYNILLEAIKTNNISAEDLLNAFTDWNGLQLIDDDFIEFLKDEQIIY